MPTVRGSSHKGAVGFGLREEAEAEAGAVAEVRNDE